MQLPRIGVMGAGKVGSTLARLWHESGCDIAAVYSRDRSRCLELAEQVQARTMDSPGEVVQCSDLILLAVPDDVIAPVADSLNGENWSGKAVIHASGAKSLEPLQRLAAVGAMTGSLHPAFPFADVETAMAKLPGAAFAIEADHPTLKSWLVDLVERLDGQVIDIPPGQKARYHAALVIASNYTVTLYAAAERLLMDLGAERPAIGQALNAMMAATLDNLVSQGTPDALTGPLTRADAGTIHAHLNALADDNLLVDVYRGLARLTYPLLAARGVEIDEIDKVLRQDENHASNDT